MTAICAKIAADIVNNCAIPLVGGVKDKLTLLNYEDLDAYTRNGANPQIIEAVDKVATMRAFSYEGMNNSIDAKTELVKTKYSKGFKHDLVFRIFSNSPTIKAEIEKLCAGKVIAFVENNYKGTAGNAAFEIFGTDLGLELKSLVQDKSDSETQGAWVLTLGCSDAYNEPHLPATLFITDYATTKVVYDGLIVA